MPASTAASTSAHAQRICPGPRSQEALHAFAAELDDIKRDTQAQLGQEDARYIVRLLWAIRGLESSGRLLLLLAPWWPTLWAGVAALTIAKILSAMEFGHNVMHGQYDWMNDPRFNGQQHDWDLACSKEDWRHTHNFEHHVYTNVQGLDRDFGFGTFRLSNDTPWEWRNVFQVPYFVLNAMLFEWGVGGYNLHPEKLLTDRNAAMVRIKALWPQARAKMWRQLKRDHIVWPLLGALVAGIGGADPISGLLAVLLGHVLAGIFRSIWACIVIMCGHLTAGTYTFDAASLHDEPAGRWYLRQILCSSNIRGGPLMHLLTGNLSHQIEHHLYPDIPARRYAAMAPRVQDVCRRHGVPYVNGSLPVLFYAFLKRLLRHSLPGGERTLGQFPQAN